MDFLLPTYSIFHLFISPTSRTAIFTYKDNKWEKMGIGYVNVLPGDSNKRLVVRGANTLGTIWINTHVAEHFKACLKSEKAMTVGYFKKLDFGYLLEFFKIRTLNIFWNLRALKIKRSPNFRNFKSNIFRSVFPRRPKTTKSQLSNTC